ncbi:MAG: DNA primase [Pseudomonadota bacterium]
MTSVIPEDKVSEIKNAVDIVEIVSETVILKKAGQNYQGLCPFHVEKTPSFSVSPAKQIFYCFGCGVGGNVFSFLMKKEGLTFPEALRAVSRRCGIALPTQDLSPEQKQRMSERENLLAANRQALDYFRKSLIGPAGITARAYLEKRGLIGETIDKFQIGFAPEGWDGLVRFFRSRNVPAQLGEKVGLLKLKEEKKRHYDGFRNRVIFPIFDIGNRVIGFGGRVMDDSLPKYLNSPESMVFNKRRSLYGIQASRTECRARGAVFVVEGYFDLLALHQNKIVNSVATLGTALTLEHVQILKGFIGATGHIVLVYDSDEAGIKAAERSIEVFAKGFVDARILVLPKGHDPDSFLLQFGPEAFLERSSHALAIMPFLIEAAVKRHGLSTDGKIRIVTELKAALAAVEDGMARSLHVRDLAERIGVDETAVMEKVKAAHSDKQLGHDRSQPEGQHGAGGAISDIEKGQMNRLPPKTNRLEQQIISMMFQFPDILAEIRKRGLLSLFEDTELKTIGEHILDRCAFDPEKGQLLAADIMTSFSNAGTRDLAASLAIGDEPWDHNGCLKFIDQFEGNRKRDDKKILKRIRAAETAGDRELLTQLQMQLLKEKKSLSIR